ncbi:MAG TPA: hemerythrin domain-containing protein [Sphingomicrobium sp.]|nr:hemerythrin domain-containing protein [Sphingomicrobium sp.]
MNNLTKLEAQHDALAGMMLRLVNLVQGFNGPDLAYPIAVQLAKLAHLLRLHLATEDEWFYPAMIGSGEPFAVSLATIYRNEVGGIAEQVEAFVAQWNSSVVIALGADRFRDEMLSLFHKIEDRIGREDEELYPLARLLGIGIDIRPLAA